MVTRAAVVRVRIRVGFASVVAARVAIGVFAEARGLADAVIAAARRDARGRADETALSAVIRIGRDVGLAAVLRLAVAIDEAVPAARRRRAPRRPAVRIDGVPTRVLASARATAVLRGRFAGTARIWRSIGTRPKAPPSGAVAASRRRSTRRASRSRDRTSAGRCRVAASLVTTAALVGARTRSHVLAAFATRPEQPTMPRAAAKSRAETAPDGSSADANGLPSTNRDPLPNIASPKNGRSPASVIPRPSSAPIVAGVGGARPITEDAVTGCGRMYGSPTTKATRRTPERAWTTPVRSRQRKDRTVRKEHAGPERVRRRDGTQTKWKPKLAPFQQLGVRAPPMERRLQEGWPWNDRRKSPCSS